ncbi:MAG: hypothetical protein CHACPFDD_00567 [Phycisphaerae bacterium]|nr:hypothetical protein [Phycisphaerae bacterium]
MALTLICPNLVCGQTIVAPESSRGKVVRCAHCQKAFMVPINAKSVTSEQPEAPKPGKKPRK